MRGTVCAFDPVTGLGAVVSGGQEIPFHCIALADGTRTIATGTDVVFELIPKLGRYEAWAIRPL